LDSSHISFNQFRNNESPPVPYKVSSESFDGRTIIKGVFSRNDILRMKEEVASSRALRVFTILRDPMERSLSFFALFWGPHNRPLSTRYTMPFETFFDQNSSEHCAKGPQWDSYVRT